MKFNLIKYCLIGFIGMMLFTSCSSSRKAYLFTSFHEPADSGLRLLYSYDGYYWNDFSKIFLKPLVGTPKIMRDPSIIQDKDGTFHLVWTTEWKNSNGFGYANSKDLIHWSEEQYIPIMQSEPETVNVWAPEIFYEDSSKQYIIVWSSCIPGRFPKGLEDERNNHRLYYTTTKDFKNFSPAKLFFDGGFSSIDAVIVKKAMNDYVLVVKDNTRPELDIKVAFSNNAFGSYTNTSKTFTDKFSEGPTVVKVKDQWLIYFDAYRKKIYEAVATKDFQTFANIDSLIRVPQNHKHGTIIEVKRNFVKKLIRKSKDLK
jgi:predicted GH43/DUF377 family glycosyl hydrolase